jgi:hypothetical protein
LRIKELKWSGINGCGSVDSEWVGRERFLLSGNQSGTEILAEILRIARRRHISFGITDGVRVTLDPGTITYWYWLSSIKYKWFV